MNNKRVAIVGTVGVPACYGGFETLVENLIRYHDQAGLTKDLVVYCSSKEYMCRAPKFGSARLRYIPFRANGIQSVVYDILSLLSAVWHRSDVIILLGVSGAIALPLVRLISRAKVVTNIDGIEWRRQKWKGLAKWFLRISEGLAIHFSQEVIADNDAIADYVRSRYSSNCHVIAYGGDHAVNVDSDVVKVPFSIEKNYALTICRIEPENNVHIILSAFSKQIKLNLVVVGNWNASAYGRDLKKKYQSCKNIYLIDPIYELGQLKHLRSKATLYIHGHSAGGTNPSLVEAMHFGLPVIAFDCCFNRATTEGQALYFADESQLLELLEETTPSGLASVGAVMLDVAKRRYRWEVIGQEYFTLVG